MLPIAQEIRPTNAGDGEGLRQRNKEATEGLPDEPGGETLGDIRSNKLERASPEKWTAVRRRAGEVAMNEGKRFGEKIEERHMRRAKRELLGLQTEPDPDNPLATKGPKAGSSEYEEK